MANYLPWNLSGSYFEACNCESICPCRRQGERPGGRSTFGVCDFALSWHIAEGQAAQVPLAGFGVVLAGWYSDDEPKSPWRVNLYVDDRASMAQQQAMEEIFLGRAGGTALRNFAVAIGQVHAVRPALITLNHASGRQSIKAGSFVTVRAAAPTPSDNPVMCGIPGFDHPGQEMRASLLKVSDAPLQWEFAGKAAFAAEFSYRSDR